MSVTSTAAYADLLTSDRGEWEYAQTAEVTDSTIAADVRTSRDKGVEACFFSGRDMVNFFFMCDAVHTCFGPAKG